MAILVTQQFSPVLNTVCFQAHGGKLDIHVLLTCTSHITCGRLDTCKKKINKLSKRPRNASNDLKNKITKLTKKQQEEK